MKILIAYDGSTSADAAVADLQRAGIAGDVEVLVISVIDVRLTESAVADFPANQPSKVELSDAKALATTARNWIRTHFPEWKVSVQVLWGSPSDVILEKSRDWLPDLLIVGSHGRSLAGRVLLGSVSLKLAHEATCSVRVVRAGTPVDRGAVRIVVGFDGSEEAESVIRDVSRRSWPAGSEVYVVSVIAIEQSPVLQETVEHQRARLHEIVEGYRDRLHKSGLAVTAVEVEGNPKQALAAEAKRWNANIIFVGARGRSRLEEILLGSVSTAVLKHAPCAVEVVRFRRSL